MKVVRALVLTGVWLCASATVWAQSGSIEGTVTDPSTAVLPGVTVEAASPALIEQARTVVTDGRGLYKIIELRPGTYTLTFALAGFQVLKRENIVLTTGFTATINTTLQLGSLGETITVTSESPVVDTVNTSSSTTFQRELLESTPKGRGLEDVIPLASGVSTQGTPDVGDSNMASRQNIISYGVTAQPTVDFEGINGQTADAQNTSMYVNFWTFEEIQIKASGTSK